MAKKKAAKKTGSMKKAAGKGAGKRAKVISGKTKKASPKKAVKKPSAKFTPEKADQSPLSSKDLVLAYDLGGTKVAIAVVDGNGKILTTHREPVAIKRGKQATFDQLIDLGRRMIEKYPNIRAAGIASAGPLDPVSGELLDPTNFSGPDGHWGKTPLARVIQKGLKIPVVLENDAAAAMLAEHWMGAAKGYKNAMILTLGTGLGTGVIANGELVRGGRYQHTEAGHMIIGAGDLDAPCGCGMYGCAEAYLAGKAFTYRGRKRLKSELIDAVQIAARARQGDPEAVKLFDEYSEKMAITLHNFAMLYYPEIIVLTGSFAAAQDLFVENTKKRLEILLARRNRVMNLTPKIVASSLDNQAGVLGGAYVALQYLNKR